jgi:hypothetical protein
LVSDFAGAMELEMALDDECLGVLLGESAGVDPSLRTTAFTAREARSGVSELAELSVVV